MIEIAFGKLRHCAAGAAVTCRMTRLRCGGELWQDLRALAADGDERSGRSDAVALHGIVPADVAGERVETIDVSVGGYDQPIAVEQEGDVPGLQLVVGPHDLAGVAIECHGVAIESDENELFEFH